MKRKSIAVIMSAVMALSTGMMPTGLVYAQDEEESMLLEETPVEQEEEDFVESEEEVAQDIEENMSLEEILVEEEEEILEENADDMMQTEMTSEEEYETEQQEVITEMESETQDEEDEETEFSIDPLDTATEEDTISTYSDEDGVAAYDQPEGEPIESGECGENATYKLYEDGSLYIEGTGAVDYGMSRSDIKNVYISNGITSIGNYAFGNNRNLTSITLPEGLTSIESQAFWYCSSLANINIPSSVVRIEDFAFMGCNNLTTITLPERITSLGDEVFSGCSSLTTITLPEGITSLGNEVFSGCSSLTTVTLSEGLTSLGDSVFSGCSSLTNLALPSGLTSIGKSVFSNCSGLKDMILPEGLTEIGEGIFRGCSDLRTVSLPTKMEKIPDSMFASCSRLSNITLPEDVTEIGEGAFYSCSNLKALNMPSGLKKIGDSAFCYAGITEFHLPSGLTNIGADAFYECDFTSIELPESLQELGAGAFSWCTELEEITVHNIAEIKDGTFQDCWKLRKIVLPKNITRIGKNAFEYCYNLESIDLPDSVTEIDEYAFARCNNVTDIHFPKNLKTIGYGAFQNCSELLHIQLADGIESIDTYAFAGCTKLLDIYIPANNVSIESKAIGYNSDNRKKEDLIIIGNAGSTVESYAVTNGFTFHNVSDSLTYYQNVPSTCVQEGNVEYWHCNTCNVNFSNAEGTRVLYKTSIEKTEHDLIEVDYKDATCTEDGNATYWHCQFCGKNFEYSDGTYEKENVIIPAYGHNMEYYEAEEATCTGEGKKAYYRCWTCDKYFLDEKGAQEVSEQELIIPKNNVHDLYFDEGYDATCNSEGENDSYYCGRCNKRFLDAKGTKLVDEKDLMISPNNKHSLSKWVGEKATCLEEGRKTHYECSRCGKMFLDAKGTSEVSEKNLVIPRTGHKWSAWKTETEISQIPHFDGAKSYPIKIKCWIGKQRYCTNCGLTMEKSEPYTLNVNVDRVTLKYGQSTTAVKVSGMTSGDYLKSVTAGNKNLVTVSNVSKTGAFKLTANKKAGKTYIRIKLASGLETTVQVTVQKGTVKTAYIKGLNKSVSVAKGKTVKLTPTLDPISSQEKITYSSSNKNIATVSAQGVITGKSLGTAKITVKSGTKKVVLTVKVTGVKTTQLSGVPTAKSIKKGKAFTIKAVVTPKNSDEKVTYTSSNKNIVTVTAKGVVKGVKKGTATITVKSGSKKKTCKVVVK